MDTSIDPGSAMHIDVAKLGDAYLEFQYPIWQPFV